jgi:predicted transcriptional regulator
MSETRERIASHVAGAPGVHFNELVRDLDLAPGQVQYHVRRLLAGDRLVADAHHGQTHYYPPGYDPWEREALALLRRETSADVVADLITSGASSPSEVAGRVGIARSTLEWHLDRLVGAGLVEKRRDSRNRVTLALARPPRTARLLRRTEPSLPERLVDRFTRLVDALLE